MVQHTFSREVYRVKVGDWGTPVSSVTSGFRVDNTRNVLMDLTDNFYSKDPDRGTQRVNHLDPTPDS